MATEVDRDATTTQLQDKGRRRPEPRPTGGPGTLNRDASALRDNSGVLHDEATHLHQRTRGLELDDRTTEAARRAPGDLLRELADERGLSWALIARLTGVSPTAVRKWRRGESCTSDNRRAIARVVVFLQMIGDCQSPIADPASWLEMPVSDEATLTAADLYEAGELELVLELSSGRMRANEALDSFDPNWRQRYSADTRFAVVRGVDGAPVITER